MAELPFPVSSLLDRRDGFAPDCLHRQLVCGCRDCAAATSIYWSWDFNGSWTELLNPLTLFELLTQKMRWSRIGERVH